MVCEDECEGPPNFAELRDTTGFGLNVNGSICLNNICMCVLVICCDYCISNVLFSGGRMSQSVFHA